jgi:hypothetical protein
LKTNFIADVLPGLKVPAFFILYAQNYNFVFCLRGLQVIGTAGEPMLTNTIVVI